MRRMRFRMRCRSRITRTGRMGERVAGRPQRPAGCPGEADSVVYGPQTYTIACMKSYVIPQVRVEPELRAELEALLREGESLSEFVEASVRRAVEYRRLQNDFHARGDASWAAYTATGESYSVDEAMAKLRQMTAARRAELKASSK
jgi:Arc/MetJ-type ribon-helix-helix transcriptional regulator